MKRTVTLHQRQGNVRVFPMKAKTGTRDCSNCRHSESRIVGDVLRFFCKLGLLGEAQSCATYSDTRTTHVLNWHTVR